MMPDRNQVDKMKPIKVKTAPFRRAGVSPFLIRCLVGIAIGTVTATCWGQAPEAIAIRNVTVIDVIDGKSLPEQTIVLKGNQIALLGKVDKIQIPDQAKVIDGSGKFAIPGLWDMHIHWYDQTSMKLFPLNGVTGVRVMWGSLQHHTWRKQFETTDKLGPRMLIGSVIVDGPNPIWRGSIVAGDAAGGTDAVEKSIKANSDFVKVYSLLSRDAYFAIAQTCREKKIPFGGHVPMMVSAAEASDAGQKSMEHMYEILLSCSSKEDELRKLLLDKRRAGESTRIVLSNTILRKDIARRAMETYDEEKAQKLFEKLAQNKTYQCPTLTVLKNLAYLAEDEIQHNPHLKFLPPLYRNSIARKPAARDRDEERVKRARVLLKKNFELVAKMQKKGVPILAGTDCLNPFCLPGFSLHNELKLLVQAGLQPIEALQAATINAARFQGKHESMGAIRKGYVADLVLLKNNPLTNIENSTSIESVFIRGKHLDRKILDEELKSLETKYNPDKK